MCGDFYLKHGIVPKKVMLYVGLGTELGTSKGTDRVSIHIKSFGTKFQYPRTHLGAYERERDKEGETLWHDVTPATLSNTTPRANRNILKCAYISRVIWFLRTGWRSPFIKRNLLYSM